MFRWFFNVVTLLSGLALFVTAAIAICAVFGNIDWSANLPGGLQLAANNGTDSLRLGFTRWHAQSPQWYKYRPGNVPMVVTGETVVISQGPPLIAAAKIKVNFGIHEWHGVEWRSGAVSRQPVTHPTGVMSTPLVPYWSATVPWFYPLIILLICPLIWTLLFLRRRRVPEGCCKVCGYDLRATPGRCPECGSSALLDFRQAARPISL